MTLPRRDFLAFLGAATGTIALAPLALGSDAKPSLGPAKPRQLFRPVPGPMPVPTDGIPTTDQASRLGQFAVRDDISLPEGFTYDLLAAWGDRVGDSRFGYNNDYLSFIETQPGEGFLTINFEYISAVPWQQTYGTVIGVGKPALPLALVQAAVKAAGKAGIDAFGLAPSLLKAQITTLCQEALIDQGIGVIGLRRNSQGPNPGQWERSYAKADRRITGISGLKDGRYLGCTGPARAVFRKTSGQGYLDQLGDRIIGSFGNCAGGTTPWGTVLSAEENIQSQVPEAVYGDGTAFAPSARTFTIDSEELSGQGNVFGLAGNKYGWIVEVDPANPQDFGTKHTWLGRYRHEAVGIRVEAGKPLAFYSGCDRRGGHLYKFVSRDRVTNPRSKANSKLLAQGMLYAAQFNADGTGRWIALQASTAVNPTLPSQLIGGMIPLPLRPEGGFTAVKTDEAIASFKQQFKTLGDLYSGSPEEQQGAILIDAHYAANAAGATCTARPEDTKIAADGSLYVTFTSGSSGGDGGPDLRIFKGPQGETPYEYGFITRLIEDQNDPAAMTFGWSMLALGGEPVAGGAGFANPDNLLIDPRGNVWIVTDMSTDRLNYAVPERQESDGKAVSQSKLRGLFGNNSMWMMPTRGTDAGLAYRFAIGPMECEMTGPFLSRDRRSLFLSVQHPGEVHGIRRADRPSETRRFALQTTGGETFVQDREVPIGSNWPSLQLDQAPRPGVVVVRRIDRAALV